MDATAWSIAAMTRYRSADHNLTSWTSWEPERKAERINDHIVMSRGNSNSYLVSSEAGDVIVNTGTAYQGVRHRERFEEEIGRELRVRKIVFTQSHPDHVGGWSAFTGPGVETIAQARFPEGRLDRTRLGRFLEPRHARLMGKKIGFDDPERKRAYHATPEPEVSTFYQDSYAFEVGARAFELYSTPGGEARDGTIVWLPAERTVFTGNLMGALFPQIPHLSTLRGDRLRSALEYVRSIDRVLDLKPALLITGHGAPIAGEQHIREQLTRLRDGARYVNDETVKGMNEGKDLWTLMREIELPPELQVGPNRGPVSWSVRAVWEEYVGWFRFESTTELYPVPPRAVWGDLCRLAGGPDALAQRAAEHAAAHRPVEALHLTDIALSVVPDHRRALEVELSALEQLMDATGGDNFDELRWLESEIERVEALLKDAEPAPRGV